MTKHQFNIVDEQKTPIELTITGTLPAAVAGTLYRTGPAFHVVEDAPKGNFSLSHWFDGWSTVYRFQLEPADDGKCKAFLNSRRQVDPLVEVARKTGKLDGFSFGQKRDPCESFFQKLKSIFAPRHSADPKGHNVAVTIHPTSRQDGSNETTGEMMARTDNTEYKKLDSETLEPRGIVQQSKLHPDLSGPVSCAHAQFDPKTGDCYNYNLDFGRQSTYRVFRTSADTGKTEILAVIKGIGVQPAYVHSFFLTENFAILCVWPSYFSAGGVKVLWTRNLLDAMYFDSSAESHWYVVDRRGGNGLVATFTSPAMFSFHTINAYEVPATSDPSKVDIICDLCEYKNMDVLYRLYYENLTSQGQGTSSFLSFKGDLVRQSYGSYALRSIPLNGPTISLTQKPSTSHPTAESILRLQPPMIGELPTINPLHATKQHRYVYGLCDRGLSSFMDGLVKTDIKDQNAIYWSTPKHTPGEAIFVPDPARNGKEDGGFLLSVVLDGDKGTSYLLCLDAENMQEVGRAEAGTPVGIGFHGCHVPSIL